MPTEEYLKLREKCKVNVSYDEIWEIIQKGSMPALYQEEDLL